MTPIGPDPDLWVHRKPRASAPLTKVKGCIFCGARDLSREHIIGEWVQQHITKRSPYNFHAVTLTFSDGRTYERAGALNRPGDMFSKKLKVVCRKCNNEWMSGMQTAAKPILTRLLRDEWPDDLSSNERAALAAWCAMTALVMDFIDDIQVEPSPVERHHLMRTGLPPKSMVTWLGRLGKHTKWSGTMCPQFEHVLRTRDPATGAGITPIPFTKRMAGWGMNNLFVQVARTTLDGTLPDPAHTAQKFGLRLLWPSPGTEPFNRPERALTDDDAENVGLYQSSGAIKMQLRPWETGFMGTPRAPHDAIEHPQSGYAWPAVLRPKYK